MDLDRNKDVHVSFLQSPWSFFFCLLQQTIGDILQWSSNQPRKGIKYRNEDKTTYFVIAFFAWFLCFNPFQNQQQHDLITMHKMDPQCPTILEFKLWVLNINNII